MNRPGAVVSQRLSSNAESATSLAAGALDLARFATADP